MTRTLIAQPLTAEAFAPFGDIIHADAAKAVGINYGATTRFDDLADVSVEGGRAIVSIFRSTPLPQPLQLTILERHPLGSQAFVPLNGRPYLVVVAPPGDLDPARAQAFLARPDQGVNYAPGVWHHFLLALEETSDFLVIDRAGPGNNLDEVTLDEPLTVHMTAI